MSERQQTGERIKRVAGFLLAALLSTFLAFASFGAMLALGYSVLEIEFQDKLYGWWGLSFLVSYLVLAAGLIVGVRRFGPRPPRTIGYATVVIATTFVAVLLVAFVDLMITVMAFPPYG